MRYLPVLILTAVGLHAPHTYSQVQSTGEAPESPAAAVILQSPTRQGTAGSLDCNARQATLFTPDITPQIRRAYEATEGRLRALQGRYMAQARVEGDRISAAFQADRDRGTRASRRIHFFTPLEEISRISRTLNSGAYQLREDLIEVDIRAKTKECLAQSDAIEWPRGTDQFANMRLSNELRCKQRSYAMRACGAADACTGHLLHLAATEPNAEIPADVQQAFPNIRKNILQFRFYAQALSAVQTQQEILRLRQNQFRLQEMLQSRNPLGSLRALNDFRLQFQLIERNAESPLGRGIRDAVAPFGARLEEMTRRFEEAQAACSAAASPSQEQAATRSAVRRRRPQLSDENEAKSEPETPPASEKAAPAH